MKTFFSSEQNSSFLLSTCNFLLVVNTLYISLPFNLGCKKSPTEVIDNTQPGRRDYVWTVDTLKVLIGTQMSILRMWGSSPNDIWATGDAEESKLGLWHYDGDKWTCNNTSRPMMPRGIWGTSKDNIWIGNINNTFWHYDGINWTQYSKHSLSGYSELINQSMCGDSPNNIYATGFADNSVGSGTKAIIQHFDGKNWDFLNCPTVISNFAQIKKNNANQYFISSIDEMNTQFPNKIFLLNGNQLIKIFETDKFISLVQIGNEVFFNTDLKLYRYTEHGLEVYKDLTDLYFRAAIIGRNSKDIFFWYTDGIKHFNGTDIQMVFPSNVNIQIVSAICFDKEVFFLAKDFESNISMCIKGKLKE